MFQLADIQKIHRAKCGKSDCGRLNLSMDGVQESKSSNVTTDAFTVSFPECKKVYPLRLIRPFNRYKYDDQKEIKHVLDDINKCKCRLLKAIFDNPKRARARLAFSHSGKFSCEYCEGTSVSVSDPNVSRDMEEVKKKFNIRKQSIENTITFLRESPGTTLAKKRTKRKFKNLSHYFIC